MAAKTVKLTLRLPAELHKQLTELAEREDRSINGQVLRFIRYGLDPALTARYLKNAGWTPPASHPTPEPSPRDPPKPERRPRLNLLQNEALIWAAHGSALAAMFAELLPVA